MGTGWVGGAVWVCLVGWGGVAVGCWPSCWRTAWQARQLTSGRERVAGWAQVDRVRTENLESSKPNELFLFDISHPYGPTGHR